MIIRIICMIISFMCSFSVTAKEQGWGNHLVLNLVGAVSMYESTVPDIDGDEVDDDAICFDVNLVDMKNNHVIGTATDCLSNITPTGTGLSLVGTSFFHMPQGTIIPRGKTTVQPILVSTLKSRANHNLQFLSDWL